MVPLDLSSGLKTPYPATSPSLLANFVRINKGDSIETAPNATSELYYVISGAGQTRINGKTIPWKTGDFLTLPAQSQSKHTALEDAALYYIVKVDPKTSQIIDPVRVEWETGKAFVTPPGLWHSHHNESGEAAFIIPIQDAGLQTYLRTLDIQFTFYES